MSSHLSALPLLPPCPHVRCYGSYLLLFLPVYIFKLWAGNLSFNHRVANMGPVKKSVHHPDVQHLEPDTG